MYSQIPCSFAQVLQQERQGAVLRGRGLGPEVEDELGWCPQTHNPMGGTLHDQGSHTANVLQVSSPGRYGHTKLVAHRQA